MTALFAIIIFFLVFVLVYLTISFVVAIGAGWMKHRAKTKKGGVNIREIEQRADRVKEKAFLIALIFTFFVVTPFVVILWVRS